MQFRKGLTRAGITAAMLITGGIIVENELSAQGYTIAEPGQSVTAPRKKDRFVNSEPVAPNSPWKIFGILKRYITDEQKDKTPLQSLPVRQVTLADLTALPGNDVFVIKLGHSTVLMKVYGEYWLFDPVFSERASPFSFLGPKRFHAPPIALDELPVIDKVFISHNHYDHLDKQSIAALVAKTRQFLVPLGVEKALVRWGVDPDVVQSFDWWQEKSTAQGLVAFTPTRHFSGRGLRDNNTTLWGSWVVQTPRGNVYFSGDSGYFDGFKQIGEKYGPFDLTLIETGAYDKDWPDIHMQPEESLQAHLDLQGRVMMPIHNGTFDLAFHSWYEPLERIAALATDNHVTLTTPEFGEVISVADSVREQRWWREVMDAL